MINVYQADKGWQFIFNALHPKISHKEKKRQLERISRIFNAVFDGNIAMLAKEKPHAIELLYLPMDSSGNTAILYAQNHKKQNLLDYIYSCIMPCRSDDDDNDTKENKSLWEVSELPDEYFNRPAAFLPQADTLHAANAKLKWSIATRQPQSQCLKWMPELTWPNDEAFDKKSYHDILEVAAQVGNQEIVTLIADAWNSRTNKTFAGRYEVAMQYAAYFGHLDIFKYLLEIVESLPYSDLNYSMLCRIKKYAIDTAIQHNCLPLLKMVDSYLFYYYNDTSKNNHPVCLSAKYHYVEMLKYLLTINPEWGRAREANGNYPIIDAFLKHDFAIVKMFIPYFDIAVLQQLSLQCNEDQVISFCKLLPKTYIDQSDDEGVEKNIFDDKAKLYLLNQASSEGKLKIVKYLLHENPALLNMKNSEGLSSLKISLLSNQQAISKYLLERKATIDKEDEKAYKLYCYIVNREKDKRDYFHKITIFGRVIFAFGGCSREEKLSAAKKLMSQYAKPGLTPFFSAREIKALNQGRLGKIKNY